MCSSITGFLYERINISRSPTYLEFGKDKNYDYRKKSEIYKTYNWIQFTKNSKLHSAKNYKRSLMIRSEGG